MEPIRPLPRGARLAEQVAEQLRTYIAVNGMKKGTKLPSLAQLAQQFGVSTATVREAIQALTYVGLLEVRHGEGVYVSGFNATPIAEHLLLGLSDEDPLASLGHAYDVRELFEVNVLDWALPGLIDAWCEEQTACVHQLLAEPSQDQKMQYDRGFHLSLAALTGNPMMVRFGDVVEKTFTVLRTLHSLDGAIYPAEETAQEHLEIIEALRERKIGLAKERLRAHIRKSRSAALSLLERLLAERRTSDTANAPRIRTGST